MRKPVLVRVLALVVPVALAGAYVGYRAFASSRAEPRPPATPDSTLLKPTPPSEADFLLRSSKSLGGLTFDKPATPPADAAKEPPSVEDPAIFHGSKSAPMFEPEDVKRAGGTK